ncbi:hypothetical protein DWX23_18900 [Parabacteroides sp. AF18-52]|jgi:hypothetical protein|nr:hypothetical protein DWX23_18900 [Parabacteroides sp. AF18-52]
MYKYKSFYPVYGSNKKYYKILNKEVSKQIWRVVNRYKDDEDSLDKVLKATIDEVLTKYIHFYNPYILLEKMIISYDKVHPNIQDDKIKLRFHWFWIGNNKKLEEHRALFRSSIDQKGSLVCP